MNEGGISASLAPPGGVGVYMKKDVEDEYYAGAGGKSGGDSSASSRRPSPAPPSTPRKTTGTLTSDLPNVRTKQAKPSTSNQASKVVVSGGQSMRGAGHDITSLESALRSLEASTNPTLTVRRCDCQGLQHEPFAAAPNCMSCGYIICMLNGPSPCNFCGTLPLSSSDTQAMIRVLRDERGKEKMALDATAHQKATQHRDKLLSYQRDNTQRTKIIDQAGDWDVGDAGSGMWMSPTERALQLKKQQKAMEKVQWANKQDYEKRRVVVSIDLQGRRIVRQMQDIPAPGEDDEEMDAEEAALVKAVEEERQKKAATGSASGNGGGTFARNPLLKGLVRPVYNSGKGKGKVPEVPDDLNRDKTKWRRVQDSLEDNEELLLDGPRRIVSEAAMDTDGPCG